MDRFSNINTLWATTLVAELARNGLRDVVITPGSRSTPLVLAFAAHPDIRDHTLIDERSAGFYAIGISQGTGLPVALVCTSGTAVANYMPAVCEADQNRVPLLILTADRPETLRDTGASQAMNQLAIFGPRVRWFHETAQPEADVTKVAYLRTLASRAMASASGPDPGPVHLNMPFRKPLEPTDLPVKSRDSARGLELDDIAISGRPAGAPFEHRTTPRLTVGDEVINTLATRIASAERPLIIAGYLADGRRLREALRSLTERAQIPVWAEAASQLRFDSARPRAWLAADALVADENLSRILDPDLVITLGRPPINWPIQRWMKALPEWTEFIRIVSVSHPSGATDPDHRGGLTVATDPLDLISRLSAQVTPVETRDWYDWHVAAADALQVDPMLGDNLSAGGVFTHLVASVPTDTALVVSSSMPLRELETFADRSANELEVFANRGLNGIDGVLSTGLGIATTREQTVVVIGDVAFAHDVGALVAARRNAIHAVIVVINNSGGAIFDYLPVADYNPQVFERHFRTAPDIDIQAVAQAFGVEYANPTTWETFDSTLDEALQSEDLTIIEVQTRAEWSREVHRGHLQRAVKIHPPPLGPGTIRAEHTETPIVLLHGFTGDRTTWHEIASQVDHTTIALDMLGHGTGRIPAKVEAFGMDAHVEDILDQLDARGIKKAHFVGYSMGGRVAIAIAVEHPERVASLVAIGANAGLASEKERDERIAHDQELAAWIDENGLHAFVDQWMSKPIFAQTFEQRGPDWVRGSRAQRLRGTARGYASSLRGVGQGAQPVYWDRLGELEIPALYIAGSQDPKYAGIARRLSEATPRGQMRLIDATHAAHVDAPDGVAEALNTFYKELDDER